MRFVRVYLDIYRQDAESFQTRKNSIENTPTSPIKKQKRSTQFGMTAFFEPQSSIKIDP